MPHQLNFEKLVSYDNDDDGIGLEVEIRYSETSVTINAKIDTGATYSVLKDVSAKHSVYTSKAECANASARRRAVFTLTVFA